jgi:hypothetical protein
LSEDVGIDAALRGYKEELEQCDRDITQLSKMAEELRPTVKKFEELRSRLKETKKNRRALYTRVKTVAEFLRKVTGEFPDYMYPLFSKSTEESDHTAAGGKAA